MASDPISRHGAQASVFSSGAVFRYVVLACLFTAAVFLQVGSTRAILHRVPVDIPMFSPAPASAALEYVDSQAHRPTRDADFLSQGENDPARLEATFKEVCTTSVADDGLVFDPESVTARRIKEDADYEGVRVNFLGFLEKARIPIQIDIGFGDAITPHAVKSTFPAMLNGPAPVLLTYPKETVVAEKFEAMVKLGIANSRICL